MRSDPIVFLMVHPLHRERAQPFIQEMGKTGLDVRVSEKTPYGRAVFHALSEAAHENRPVVICDSDGYFRPEDVKRVARLAEAFPSLYIKPMRKNVGFQSRILAAIAKLVVRRPAALRDVSNGFFAVGSELVSHFAIISFPFLDLSFAINTYLTTYAALKDILLSVEVAEGKNPRVGSARPKRIQFLHLRAIVAAFVINYFFEFLSESVLTKLGQQLLSVFGASD